MSKLEQFCEGSLVRDVLFWLVVWLEELASSFIAESKSSMMWAPCEFNSEDYVNSKARGIVVP